MRSPQADVWQTTPGGVRMNEHEKFFFDVNGYLVVEELLTPEEVRACNDAIDHQSELIRERPEEESLAGGSKVLRGDRRRGDLAGMLTWPKPWCQPFRDLLAHPGIVPYLLELLRDGFRLDHLYGIVMRRGAEGFVLHGGGTADDLTGFYQFHDGNMRCGLTVVAWTLTDCGPGDGGFACIPGSHKANYPTPRDVALLENDIGVVKQVEAKAGSAIIFTEALTHGTVPWTAEHERRAILYKYSPGTLSWARDHLPQGVEDILEELSPNRGRCWSLPTVPTALPSRLREAQESLRGTAT